MEIEVDENGTLDLSMKKHIKRDVPPPNTSPGVRSPALSSSSSSFSSSSTSSTSGHHSNNSISPHLQSYKQEGWEGPLDYTKPNRQREEELEEVRVDNQITMNTTEQKNKCLAHWSRDSEYIEMNRNEKCDLPGP